MKVLVVGYGSIGSRHIRILSSLREQGRALDLAVCSRRTLPTENGVLFFERLDSALEAFEPSHIVVSNKTSEHAETLEQLAAMNCNAHVLVEKPLFYHVRPIPRNSFASLSVGYNLRFHPLIQRLRDLLRGETLISAQVSVGQFLPTWRPGRDYRNQYSAKAAEGGGVLRDLSHELDYVNWLFQGWTKLAALGGHLSRLEIDSDDVFAALLQTKRCPIVSLHMDYLDRKSFREIVINTYERTIRVDLIKGKLMVDSEEEDVQCPRNLSYECMLRAFLSEEKADICSSEEGLAVVAMVEAMEKSVRESSWVPI